MMNQTGSKFYVVEIDYVGPNKNYDADTIGVYKTPATGNMDGQPVIDGWAGTTNNWSTIAHGVFDTLAAAEAKIAELYPERRHDDDIYDPYGDCLALYKPGKYATMTSDGTADWLYEATSSLAGSETDEELEKIVAVAEANANDEGCTLHQSALDMLTDARDAKWLARSWME